MQHIAFLIGKREPSILGDYLDMVADRGLLAYKAIAQWGSKEGQPLYVHVLNGIFVLETLRDILGLSDVEARILYAAYTLHDLNKTPDYVDQPFGKAATVEHLAFEMQRLGLSSFFPDWQTYIQDITSLVRGHSGHHHSGGERWIVKRSPVYGLGLERVNALLHLVRAADVVDLSHTLEERTHKASFLGHLNAFAADSGHSTQWTLFSHQLTEQRGILTNVVHNAIAEVMRQRHDLVPLLFYPEGIVYLCPKGVNITVSQDDMTRMGRRAARVIADMTADRFSAFIRSTQQGIKVDAKCLELGMPFEEIWREVYNKVQGRHLDPTDLESKIRTRTARSLNRNAALVSQVAAKQVQLALADMETPLAPTDDARLRIAELVRSYYILINTHFRDQVAEPWEHIYRLLEVPEDRWPVYAYFDPRYDRPYVLARDLHFDEQTVYQRLQVDGCALLETSNVVEDPRAPFLTEYLSRYAVFGATEQPARSFQDHLAHYVQHQHKQCVYCSSSFPTDRWMAADVRSDITVQTFSNRLRGGPGEPKKYVCAICQMQFLLERLNYPRVRGEKILYLHLYPYSFLSAPFIEGLKASIQRVIGEDTAVQALNMNTVEGIEAYLADRTAVPTFRSRTNKGRPQPYGIYLPQYAETVGNLVIFPINPGGQNDTERFLFALWNALLLQRYFGVKVLVSNAPVPPLGKRHIPDLYVDNIPLACRGLLRDNAYAQFVDGTNRPGNLPRLWTDVQDLFALRRLTFTTEDNTSRLVRSLAGNPLTVFYETDRLLESRVRGAESGGLITWLSQQAFPHVQRLALGRGGAFMAQLSSQLQRLAEIAWENRLRGRSLERSSLLYPIDEVLAKSRQTHGHADREALRAAAAQDIYDHLYRIADDQYKPGRTRWEAIKQFVDIWFDDVVGDVYGGNLRRLLSDEKLVRSAYLFYVREQIPRKQSSENIE